MSGAFLQNTWYMAGWASELDAGRVARIIAGIPIVVVRNAQQQVYTLHDRCPHRFAPLSKGRITDAGLECGYHGLTFGPNGKCVAYPLGGTAPAAAIVRSFPVSVLDGIIWVWMGRPEAASIDSIVRFPCFSAPNAKFVYGVTRVEANYELLSDNLLDLTHAVYIHPSFGDSSQRPKANMEQQGDTVYSRYLNLDVPNSSFVESFWPTHGTHVDNWDDIRWNAPAVHYLESGTTRTGRPREEGVMIPAVHIITPESLVRSTYFWASAMAPGSTDEKDLYDSLRHVFETEDKPMIEAIQERMGTDTFWDLKPILLKNDSGSVFARRILAEKIANETAVA
jgi:phenylpropionate dioxygenase-like ring-hydroxylating dioxygenase large terminal subunit